MGIEYITLYELLKSSCCAKFFVVSYSIRSGFTEIPVVMLFFLAVFASENSQFLQVSRNEKALMDARKAIAMDPSSVKGRYRFVYHFP